jgi:ADP-heptose:LPS heptosyltransferase
MSFGEGQLAVSPRGSGFPPWMDVHVEEPLDVGTTRKVLIVRTDHLGDLVLSTPFIETVRRNLPRSRISALVTPYIRPVLEGNPSLDEVVVLDREGASEARNEVLRQLRAEKFDLCIALSPTMRSYAIARTVKARLRAGYIYSRRWVPRALSGVILTHRVVLHIDALVEKGQAVPHEVEQTLWFARALGFSADPVPLRVYPDPAEMKAVWASLGETVEAVEHDSEWNVVMRRDRPWMAVHLAPAWLRPPWGLEHFTELLKALQAAIPGLNLVITYGPGEEAAGSELASGALPPGMHVRGGLRFGEWAGLLGGARIALSPDTGAVHVAAAMRTPVIVAYEEATWALCSQQWAPWMVAHRKVRKGFPRNDTIPRLVDAAVDLWKPGR